MTFTVLRTAAGAPVAPCVIRALQSMPGVRVVAVDAEPLSCGFQLADAHYVVPLVSSPTFLPAMLRICQQESVDVLFPDLDEELPLLAGAQGEFAAIGTRILVSSPETIRTCFDKYTTYQFFREHGIPTPKTYLPEHLGHEQNLRFPMIVKPRSGRGSTDVFKVTNPEEFLFFVDYAKNPIVQEFVHGTEYTIDTLSDLEGNFLYCSVRQRIATDSGISVKGRTVSHPVINEYAKRIANALGIIGPGCLQCIEREDGQVKFTEVNPRIGGGIALSMAAGAPIVTDSVKLMRGEAPEGLKAYRPGLIMLRYWAEVFTGKDVL